MFYQFSYRFIPLIVGLLLGAPPRRGGSTVTRESDLGEKSDLSETPRRAVVCGGEVDRPDRGDVPGWVLITLMTAGLVVALWALAGEAFTSMFQDAMNKVRGAG